MAGTDNPGRNCPTCGSELTAAGNCLNIDCRRAAEQATAGAARATRKATVPQPRAFQRSGRVD